MMKTFRVAALMLCLAAGAASAQAPAPLPKPGAEQNKMASWVGTWTYEGQAKTNVFGPAGRITGTDVYEMLPGGFFLQHRWDERNPLGRVTGMEIWGWDATNKNYTYNYFSSLGERGMGTFTWVGNNWHSAGSGLSYDGKPARGRCDGTFAGTTSVTYKCESSADGKTWIPSFEGKWTKK